MNGSVVGSRFVVPFTSVGLSRTNTTVVPLAPLSSYYVAVRACFPYPAGCHLPVVSGATAIDSVAPRSGMVGGNFSESGQTVQVVALWDHFYEVCLSCLVQALTKRWSSPTTLSGKCRLRSTSGLWLLRKRGPWRTSHGDPSSLGLVTNTAILFGARGNCSSASVSFNGVQNRKHQLVDSRCCAAKQLTPPTSMGGGSRFLP